MKCKIYKPKSIIEAINELQTFLECDMWSKFYPEHKIPIDGKTVKLYRQDVFTSEEDFIDYLDGHFKILKNQIKTLRRKK